MIAFFMKTLLIIGLSIQLIIASKLNNDCLTMHPRKFPHLMQKDGDFRMVLRDMNGRMVDRFEPGKEYKFILDNAMYGMNYKAFSVFNSLDMDDSMKMDMEENMVSMNMIGQFLIAKRYGMVNEECPNMIHNTHDGFFTMIEAIWKAPNNPVKCVKFQAQVIKTDSMVFENTGNLMKVFCPTVMHKMMKKDDLGMKISSTADGMAPMVKECCACGVASYRVTFTGLWSKKTHPKDWPKQKAMLHWTNLIGATHTGNYFIYYNGGQASQAVQSICAYGDNTVLKQQFAEEAVKPHLKSYFNTSGMWNEDELEQSRTGFISVNRTHHLFSFLTMLGPSPDWCTGLAAVDLCMGDCTWKENITMDLYPFDAGIKYGHTYLPLNSDRLDVPDPIRIINTTIMGEYPFTPQMPVGRMVFQKIKPNKFWQCTKMPAKEVNEFDEMNSKTNDGAQFEGNSLVKKRKNTSKKNPLDDPAFANMATFLCLTSQWSHWSRCSVTCGVGTEMRQREMIKNAKTELCRHLPLEESRSCEGRKRACDFSARCSLLSWSRWGPCNATCEKSGYQHRSRMFARANEKEECLREFGKTVNITESKVCTKETSLCDPVVICSEGLITGSKCGKPVMRYFYDAAKHSCMSFTYLGCKGSLNNFKTKMICEKTCLEAVNALPQWRKDRMAHLQFQSQSSSEKRKKMPAMADQCLLEVKYGALTCNGTMKPETRYYYDHRNSRCRQFKFTGCKGNSNSFPSYGTCIKACMPEQVEFVKRAPMKPCEVSQWSHWGPCSVGCGIGERHRWRSVLKPAMNGGTPCPELFSSEVCNGQWCY